MTTTEPNDFLLFLYNLNQRTLAKITIICNIQIILQIVNKYYKIYLVYTFSVRIFGE